MNAAWFRGFVEAEGHVCVTANGSPQFKLNLREDDKQVLDGIRAFLAIGTISTASRAYMRAKGMRACDQYSLLVSGPNCLRITEVLELGATGDPNDWLAGFADGEGSFSVHHNGSPRFKLGLREDDKAVLDDIQAFLGVGSVIRENRAYMRAKGMRACDSYALCVYGSSCLPVVETLRGRMRSKKAEEFDVWAEAVHASIALGPGNHPDRKQMMLGYKVRLEKLREHGLVYDDVKESI